MVVKADRHRQLSHLRTQTVSPTNQSLSEEAASHWVSLGRQQAHALTLTKIRERKSQYKSLSRPLPKKSPALCYWPSGLCRSLRPARLSDSSDTVCVCTNMTVTHDLSIKEIRAANHRDQIYGAWKPDEKRHRYASRTQDPKQWVRYGAGPTHGESSNENELQVQCPV